MKKRNQYMAAMTCLLLIGSISSCNLPSSAPSSAPDPNVDLSTALVVNTFRDTFDGQCTSTDCSLRDAVYQANTTSANEIFLPKGLYKLNERIGRNDDSGRYGDLDITSTIIIQGEGIDLSVIDGAYEDRIFHVLETGILELHDLTLINGIGDDPIFNKPKSTTDTVLDCVFSLFTNCGNDGYIGPPSDFVHMVDETGGGAIANRGILRLDQVSIEFSVAIKGGGIFNQGDIAISGGRICNNHSRVGGGIYNYLEGSISLTEVLICSNGEIGDDLPDWGNDFSFNDNSDITFFGGGGGIYNDDRATMRIVGGEISQNEASPNGSAIWNRGIAVLESVQVTKNTPGDEPFGSAILNEGNRSSFTITDGEGGFSRISENLVDSAISNRGKLAISNTLIQDNTSRSHGVISNFDDGNLAISQSLISGNVGEDGPGGLGIYGGTLQLTNVSIGRNVGPTNRDVCKTEVCAESIGAVHMEGGFAEIINVTIFGNDYGLVVVSGTALIRNTILAGNRDFRGIELNCVGEVGSMGHNLDGGDTCKLDGERDLSSTDPLIDPALDVGNGFTFAIPANSPAIGKPEDQSCPPIDQQGESRPMGLGCDIGADEKQEISVAPIVSDTTPVQPAAVEPANEVAQPPTLTKVVVVPPTSTFTPVPPTLTPIPPDPMNAGISGSVWNDSNANGTQQGIEPGLAAQTVQLGFGACSSSGLKSSASNLGGGYSFTGLAAGTYCVSVQRVEKCGDVTSATTPKEVTLVLAAGQSAVVSFGFQKVIC